jgi:prepilin-type N-terminal cleavage/methylation domain-containing protein
MIQVRSEPSSPNGKGVIVATRKVRCGTGQPSGFTLIEILVVLAVVGLMGAMAMFKIGAYSDQIKLRQTAEGIHQILAWAKLQAEKSGDTVLVKIRLPEISVWRDRNGSGKWESTDLLLRLDSMPTCVKVLKPVAGPSEAPVAPSSGLADGVGTCGGNVCCTGGSMANPSWSDSVVNFCSRTSPQLAPLEEDGGVYLASTNTKVKEMWAIVANRAKSVEPTLWTSEIAPTAAGNWRKIR